MLHGIGCVQYYTGKGEGSDLLIGFAHDSANRLALTHADSHLGLAVGLLHVHVSCDHTGAFLLVQAICNCAHPILFLRLKNILE